MAQGHNSLHDRMAGAPALVYTSPGELPYVPEYVRRAVRIRHDIAWNSIDAESQVDKENEDQEELIGSEPSALDIAEENRRKLSAAQAEFEGAVWGFISPEHNERAKALGYLGSKGHEQSPIHGSQATPNNEL